MALSARAAINPPWISPRELVCALASRNPMVTDLSVFLEYSGSQGSVNGLLRKCGSKPAGMSAEIWEASVSVMRASGVACLSRIERDPKSERTAYKVLNELAEVV